MIMVRYESAQIEPAEALFVSHRQPQFGKLKAGLYTTTLGSPGR
jgi:hypothetical protein